MMDTMSRCHVMVALLLLLLVGTTLPAETGKLGEDLSPPDGAVYDAGEPFLAECLYCFPGVANNTRDIEHLSFISGLGIGSDTAGEFDEMIAINHPGTYNYFNGSFFSKQITILETPERRLPRITPDPNATTGPRAVFAVFSTHPDQRSFITLDNSGSQALPTGVKNSGTSDLVLLDLFFLADYDSIRWEIEDFKPYTVVRPGETIFYKIRFTVLDGQKLVAARRNTNSLVVYSTDRVEPVMAGSTLPIAIYNTISNVPPQLILTDTFTNPTVAPCGDLNNDNRLDSADLIHHILGK